MSWRAWAAEAPDARRVRRLLAAEPDDLLVGLDNDLRLLVGALESGEPGLLAGELPPPLARLFTLARSTRAVERNLARLWGVQREPDGSLQTADGLTLAAPGEPASPVASAPAPASAAPAPVAPPAPVEDAAPQRSAPDAGPPPEVSAPAPASTPPLAQRARSVLERLAVFYNSHKPPAAPTRSFKLALEQQAAAPRAADLTLVDQASAWEAAVRLDGAEPDEVLAAELASLKTELAAELGLELRPLAVPAEDYDTVNTTLGDEAVQHRQRYSALPPGTVLAIERHGAWRGAALERSARLWVSKGPAPAHVAEAQRCVAPVLAAADGEQRQALERLLDAVDAPGEERARALIGLINACDEAAVDAAPLLAQLQDLGVAVVPIQIGEAYDQLPPELFHVRRVQRPGAPLGEVTAVLRRAFRAADDRLLQQATLEVNLND